MSLRELDDDETLKPLNARLPKRTWVWIDKAKSNPKQTITEVVVKALALDEDLAEKLGGAKLRLKAYATRRGLNLGRLYGTLIAELVMKGLDAADKESDGNGSAKK